MRFAPAMFGLLDALGLADFKPTGTRKYGPGRKTLHTVHKNIGRGKYPNVKPLQLITAPDEGRAAQRRADRRNGDMKFQRNRPLSASEIAARHKAKRRGDIVHG